MAHYAEIDENNIVINVIVAEQAVIDSGMIGDPSRFIQTSYHTESGEHLQYGFPLRKNYAGIGFTYDAERDAFIPPRPYNSWILNEATCQWEAPLPCPGPLWEWDEESHTWLEM